MTEELAALVALCYAPAAAKQPTQNAAVSAVEATAAVSLRVKAVIPQASLAWDVASPVDAKLWALLPRRSKGRPAALAVRFAHARVSVIRRCADRAVLSLRRGGRVRVVSIGAGLDGECLRLAANFAFVDCVEVDLAAVVAQKQGLLEAERVTVQAMDEALTGLNELGDAGPTLILAEVSLCYASAEASKRAKRWAASLERSCYVELTPTTKVESRFGAALQSGFSYAGGLPGAPYDAVEAASILRAAGFAHATVVDLDAARQSLSVVHPDAFDDEAALQLALRRYVVCVASGDASIARSLLRRPEVVVRPLAASDAPAAKAAYVAAMGDDISIRKHAKKQARVFDEARISFVATLNATIIGGVALADDGEVRCLAVVASARRHGAAAQLMGSIEAMAFQRRLKECFLRVPPGQTAAVALYEQRGYVSMADPLDRQRYVKAGYPTVYLVKALPVDATLVATPLVARDASAAKVFLEGDQMRFALPEALFPTMGVVLSINGERVVARRAPDLPSAPTLPPATRVALDVQYDAAPAWAWPRRVRSYAPVDGSVLDCGPGHVVDGPCACNAECVLS